MLLVLLVLLMMRMCSPTPFTAQQQGQYIHNALAADDHDDQLIMHTSASSLAREQERAALLAFKASISADPLHALASWDATNASSDPCTDRWAGIACDGASHIVSLDISGNRISGSIPEKLGSLNGLNNLDLSENSLTGTIPISFANINFLEYLDLSNNALTGSIPAQLSSLTYLAFFNVSYNHLSGPIPEELGLLTGLYSLNLSGNSLSGTIPTSLANIAYLKYLDLSNNALTGSIPAQLSKLTYLVFFNVSYNHLSGPIPHGNQFSTFSDQSYLKNANLCGVPLALSCSELANSGQPAATSQMLQTTAQRKIIISCMAAGVGIGAIAFVVLVVCIKRLKRMAKDKTHIQGFIKRHTLHPNELFEATNGYCIDNIIGQGGVSAVYKGVLRDGTIVAVKRFKMLRVDEEEKSFKAECTILGRIRHRNLVRVLGACVSKDIKALILEFIANGNLDTHLHEDPCNLEWNKRFQIALGVAHGLFYLHNDTGFGRVLHCDLKPSNVLLDADFEPHIGDFGIARLITPEEDAASVSVLRGSFGYMAPEYACGATVTDKGDVYSYGVVLLELLTRKKPTARLFDADDEGESLVGWARSAYHAKDWRRVIDPALLLIHPDEYRNDSAGRRLDEVHRVLTIALFCVNHIPKDRPSMKEVLDVLWLIVKNRSTAHPAMASQIHHNMGSTAAEADSPSVSDCLPLMVLNTHSSPS